MKLGYAVNRRVIVVVTIVIVMVVVVRVRVCVCLPQYIGYVIRVW